MDRPPSEDKYGESTPPIKVFQATPLTKENFSHLHYNTIYRTIMQIGFLA